MPDYANIPFVPPSAEEVRKSLEIEINEGAIAAAYTIVYNRGIEASAAKNRVNAPALRALCLRANLDAIVETKAVMVEKLVCFEDEPKHRLLERPSYREHCPIYLRRRLSNQL